MEMINKVQEMVTLSRAELETTIQNIEKQYNEFANQIRTDIQNSEVAMEQEIKKFMAENKPQIGKITQCKVTRDDEVAKLKIETDNDLQSAKSAFDKKIAVVQENMEVALQKLTAFYTEAQANVNKIIEENKENPLEITEKLAAQVEPMQKKFTSIREDVAKTLKANYEKSQHILKDLELSVNNIEGKTKKKYLDVITKFKNCVDKK